MERCPKDGGELETLGSFASDTWRRCKTCDRFFWSIDDDGKFQYQNDWELPVELARPALVGREPDALAQLFVRMNLPYGPGWDSPWALVELFRAMTPGATDDARARAIEHGGKHERWSTAAHVLAREAVPAPAVPELAFPVDLHVPQVDFREWYEVGDALVLLTGGAEFLRLEPRGLVRVPLAAAPKWYASSRERLILEVADSLLVIDADGDTWSWPRTGDFTVVDLDDGHWLFVPTEGETRFVELHLPNGRPRVKFPRRFAPGERFMAPPRRFGAGWLFSNLTADDGKTQALTLFDCDFRVIASSEDATPGDRLVTPIHGMAFWADVDRALERWVRRGATLVCVDLFEARTSFSAHGARVALTARGGATAYDEEGCAKWTCRRDAKGALYGVETVGGVLLYDDARAHLLDRDGNEVEAFDVDRPSVLVGRRGTVYVLSLDELFVVRERLHTLRVGLGARLETTCDDGAIVRRSDGTCLLATQDGLLGATAATGARFSVVGTRGTWIVGGGRIRGAFARNSRTLAHAIAVASGGRVVTLPTEVERSCAVVLADGRVPVVVRDFPTGTTDVWLAGAPAIQAGPTEHARVATEVAERIRGWSEKNLERPTLAEIALALVGVLQDAFHETWHARFPGTHEPHEMSLSGLDDGAAQVGLQDRGRSVFAGDVEVPDRAAIAKTCEAVVALVREQHARYEKNRAVSRRVRALADALASKVSEHAKRACHAVEWGYASYAACIRAHVVFDDDPYRRVVSIEADGDDITTHAGAPGSSGFDGRGDDAIALAPGVLAALDRLKQTLTIHDLVPGRCYRVRETFHGAAPGTILRFDRFDDIDNHWGEYIFSTEDGRELKVGGDYSTPEKSPLAAAYRWLEEIT